jgi:primosomal replication protein N
LEENRLVITGTVVRGPETRVSPSGVPITRFTVRHSSVQTEAGHRRQAACLIGVVASGEALGPTVSRLDAECRVQVGGFLSRADARHGEQRLVLHAQQIELLPDGP